MAVLASFGTFASVLLTLFVAGCASDNLSAPSRTDVDIAATPAPRATGDETVATSTSSTKATQATGDVAVWSLSTDADVTGSSESFTALVDRLDCNGGVTGEVLEPSIEVDEVTIVVTFTVESVTPGTQTCPSNDTVAFLVNVGQPIGQRVLVDGACLTDRARTTSFCTEGGTRWQPLTAGASETPTTTDIGGTTQWRAPDNSFTIGALPSGFVTQGSAQIVEAASSPAGDSLVSQTFVDLEQHALLTVSLETGPYAAQQLVAGDTTPRTDILDGTDVYVSTDANSQPTAIAWQPTNDSVVWFYGTNMLDETMFNIVRSIDVSTT